MNDEDDNMAKETIYGLAAPTSWSTEDVLFRFLNEIRHPISSLEGYTMIVSKLGIDSNYVTGLMKNVEWLRNLCNGARVYLMETNYLPHEKEVMYLFRENVFNAVMYSSEASSELKDMVVKTVHSLNAEAAWQMVDSWLPMTSRPEETELLQK